MMIRVTVLALLYCLFADCHVHIHLNDTPVPNSTCPGLPKHCPLKVADLAFYGVCLEGGTELPIGRCVNGTFPSAGVFKCACCGAPLFPVSAKCYSGPLWPAFTNAVPYSFCYPQSNSTRISCATCGAHLGDYFTTNATNVGHNCTLHGKASHFCVDGVCLDPPQPNSGGWMDSCTNNSTSGFPP
eukprot:TRINITY_DN76731_c0_g1_i1.p1 TRINITY_DN76731_c0_g1~~TRINITY_DN76731_c0_g1_i1.p1  ORF type:complete len:185 (-),score=2.13 TRINITY_DN76731_c0_g1_i1:148-702(-)